MKAPVSLQGKMLFIPVLFVLFAWQVDTPSATPRGSEKRVGVFLKKTLSFTNNCRFKNKVQYDRKYRK